MELALKASKDNAKKYDMNLGEKKRRLKANMRRENMSEEDLGRKLWGNADRNDPHKPTGGLVEEYNLLW